MLHQRFNNRVLIVASLALLYVTGSSVAGNGPFIPAGPGSWGVHGADAHHAKGGPNRLLPFPLYPRYHSYYRPYGYRGAGYGPLYIPTYPYGMYGSVAPYYGEPPLPDDPGLRPPGPGRDLPPRVPPPTPAPAPRAASTAVIEVQVPADAEVFIEGVQMNTPGANRRFTTPSLQEGRSFVYEIRATWKENGQEVSHTQHLTIRAGDRQKIMFIAAPERPNQPPADAPARPEK